MLLGMVADLIPGNEPSWIGDAITVDLIAPVKSASKFRPPPRYRLRQAFNRPSAGGRIYFERHGKGSHDIFTQKTQKTPDADLSLARRRMREFR